MFLANGVQRPSVSTAKGTNSPPAFSTVLAYLLSLLCSPCKPATPAEIDDKLIMPGCSELRTVRSK